ncbi:cytochrome P450 [Streptomyces sp. sk2.1]|uniref:cytochrome P450 n=1 Tax=Streptomyces sp. sk2.1 TaxID=2478959 RepID=UPI001652BCC2|nr:cytochrome P450 [Streptomyces sp. sk2.1]
MTATAGSSPTAFPAPSYPMERTCPYAMPTGYGPLREHRPLSRVSLYDGRRVWLVSGSDVGRELLRDPRISCDPAHPSFPCLTESMASRQVPGLPLIGVDDPLHAHQRRWVSSAFGIRRIAARRPAIERTAVRLVDAMLAAGDRADLVRAYTTPLASDTTFALLGVPHQDRPHVDELITRLLSPVDEEDGCTPEELLAQLLDYLKGLLTDRQHNPGDDLIDDLVAAHRPLTRQDLDTLAMTCVVLMSGGNETTSTALATAVLALLDHPAQLDRLRRDPSLMPDAVEELLRISSVTDALPRVATEDIDIAGHTIEAGDGVVFSTMLMNRDPDVWDSPDTFDTHRRAGRHVAFGYGIHQCVGQNLARAEMDIALTTLLRRIPTIRLDVPSQQVRGVAVHVQLGGVAELPVTW